MILEHTDLFSLLSFRPEAQWPAQQRLPPSVTPDSAAVSMLLPELFIIKRKSDLVF